MTKAGMTRAQTIKEAMTKAGTTKVKVGEIDAQA